METAKAKARKPLWLGIAVGGILVTVIIVIATQVGNSSVDLGPSGSYVNRHNTKRQLHCDTPVMTVDATLESAAQAYADTCPSGHASNADRNGAGENLCTSAQEHRCACTAQTDVCVMPPR